MGKSMYREQQQARLGGLAILAWLMTAGRGTLRRFRSLKMCMEVMMEVRWDRVVGPWAGAGAEVTQAHTGVAGGSTRAARRLGETVKVTDRQWA